MAAKTLAEKVWDQHVVVRGGGEGDATKPDLVYIDLHLVHEVTSPQAFDGLRLAGRPVRRPDLTIATEDHNVPTVDIDQPIADLVSRTQVDTLRRNCEEFGIRLHSMGDIEQGIVHIIGPQLGLTQPGTTVVCGDSHTSTHGAFGALAMGIGTSEVEHVLATQTLSLRPFKTMSVTVDGELGDDVGSKDLILAVIAQIGTGGGQGYVIEYRGEAIRKMSMEARMTICNMSIEAGARAGMIAPDEITFEYIKGRPHAPSGELWEQAVADWSTLVTDDGAVFDKEVRIDGSALTPFVTWGTNPGQGAPSVRRYPIRPRSSTRARVSPPRRRSPTWVSSRARRCATSRSTPSFWGPAPTVGSRISVWQRRSWTAVPLPTVCGCSSFPARCACAHRPRTRDWARSSLPQGRNGARRGARCVSA